MKPQKLSEVSKAQYHNKPIKIQTIVSGKSVAPYHIPKVITISFKTEDGKHVEDATIEPGDEKILNFIDSNSQFFKAAIRKCIGIPAKDFDYEVKEVQYVDRIFINSIPGQDSAEKDLGARIAFFIGKSIDINTRYELSGYTTVDPKSQTVTYVFTEGKKLQSDIEVFNITKKHPELFAFKYESQDPNVIIAHLLSLYKTYSLNITKIYERLDLHWAVDLVFHSALQFNFGDEYIKKGWLDVMVVGDPRCGKGFVAERLVEYFGVGEVVSAENSSYAGIVGGCQQFAKHWAVTWGKFPLNDTGLLIVDESQNLGDDWARISRIRSEGVAEVTKIHTQVASARTRTIYLANPIEKTISNYSYGIQSILEIVKAPEDVARFDYVLVVAHDDVMVEKINVSKPSREQQFSRDLERKLILWIWGRGRSDIVFTEQAIQAAREYSIKLSKEYDFSIPLIQGENVRIKLARIAIAFAVRCFSVDPKNHNKLVVKEVHILCAWAFLEVLYSKKSCGYLSFSKFKQSMYAGGRNIVIADEFIKGLAANESIYQALMNLNNITVKDLHEFTNKSPQLMTELISMLVKNNCVIKKGPYYVKSQAFTNWLKEVVIGDKE